MIKKRIQRTAAAFLSAAMLCTAMLPASASAYVQPCPVLSRNCPVYAGSGQATAANDEHYFSFWFSNAPDYLAYDISAVPEENRREMILAWYNATGQYDPSILNGGSTNGVPSAYTIEVNFAPGGTYPEDGWEEVENVTGNTLHSRQHFICADGANWVRMRITEADGKEGGSISLQMDLHAYDLNNYSEPADSWIFFGDSITAGGMMNCYGSPFAELVNAIDSQYYPAQENGGIGGIFSTDGRNNIERWLEYAPYSFVSIAYGTNDAWGNQTGAQQYYENTVYMIEAVLERDMHPILPTIPYATEEGVNAYLDEYNAMVHKIYEEYPEVIKGPDFDTFFREHPEYLSSDGVHPSSEGYAAMRQLWAETMYENVYTAELPRPELPTGTESDTEYVDPTSNCIPPLAEPFADINEDGDCNVLDIILLQKYLLGVEKFTEYQYWTADVNWDDSVDAFDLTIIKMGLIGW